jgi:CRISPR-associated protein Csx17
MGYLKALGVLRLISEQADTRTRGFWRDGAFVLETKLDRGQVLRFFMEQYSPTPTCPNSLSAPKCAGGMR